MKRRPRYSYTYCLAEPDTGIPRYIGASIWPAKRRAQHIAEARQPNSSALTEWIRSLIARNLEPRLIILGRFPIGQIVFRERKCIEQFRAAGCDLFNQHAPAFPAHFRAAYRKEQQ